MDSSALKPAPASIRKHFEKSLELKALESPNDLDSPYCPVPALMQRQPSRPNPIPRPSIPRGHKSALAAVQVECPREHENPFVLEHQGIDERERFDRAFYVYVELSVLPKCSKRDISSIDERDSANRSLHHDTELSVTTESSKHMNLQSPPKESTNKAATSRPGLFGRVAGYFQVPFKATETSSKPIRDELEEEPQKALSKVQDLNAEMQMRNHISENRIGLTAASFIRHQDRMRLREAETDLADIKAKLPKVIEKPGSADLNGKIRKTMSEYEIFKAGSLPLNGKIATDGYTTRIGWQHRSLNAYGVSQESRSVIRRRIGFGML